MIPLILIILVLSGIVIISVVVGRRRDAQRQAALALVAAEWGMGFMPQDYTLLQQFGGFAFYQHGRSPVATSVMYGTSLGFPIVLFDYLVTTGSYNSGDLTRLTVAAFDLASNPPPLFEAEGERGRWVDKVFADKRIDFPDDPDFTQEFCVTTSDPDGVRRFLGPQVRAFLMQRNDWMFRSNGRWLLMCRRRRLPTPEDYRAFAMEAVLVMQVIDGARG